VIFSELRFLFFFVAVFGVYWLLPGHRARKLWLLGVSYVFYGAWNEKLLLLIVASTVLDYVVGLGLLATDEPRKRWRWMLLSLIGNLGMLGFFKYYNFFVESGAAFLTWLGLPTSPATLDIILPVGISFYTFQTLSYSIDCWRGNLKPTRSLLDFALFVTFFPQLVAGPIVRAIDFMPQLDAPRCWAWVKARPCLLLFMVGFIKKSVVSDSIAPFVDAYFAAPTAYDALSSWVAVPLWTAQLYCDFSGYSDMAIATAGLLGYNLCDNFAHPYFAASITDFWRRWHISLSFWLRDYIYFPLGGSRGSNLLTWRNITITWLLSGLWHGADWHYVAFGAVMPPALIVHRHWTRAGLRLPAGVGVLLTYLYMCMAFVLLRATNMAAAGEVLSAFFLFDSPGTVLIGDRLHWVFLGLALVHWVAYRELLSAWWARMPRLLFAAAYGVLAALLLALSSPQAQPFVYFQF